MTGLENKFSSLAHIPRSVIGSKKYENWDCRKLHNKGFHCLYRSIEIYYLEYLKVHGSGVITVVTEATANFRAPEPAWHHCKVYNLRPKTILDRHLKLLSKSHICAFSTSLPTVATLRNFVV